MEIFLYKKNIFQTELDGLGKREKSFAGSNMYISSVLHNIDMKKIVRSFKLAITMIRQ